MADSDQINSHPRENQNDARINIAGAELQALIDNAVTKALDRQYSESSGTRSRTLSAPHSKPKTHSEAHNKPPPSKKDEPKKDDDDRYSSNRQSVPSQKIVLNQGPRDKGAPTNTLCHANPRISLREKGLYTA